MKECTIIAKVQLTDIVKLEPGEQLEDKATIAKVIKKDLKRYYDDVVVEKVQVFEHEKRPDNYTHIKTMDVDQMAKLLTDYDTRYECYHLRNGEITRSEEEAIADTKAWLLEEVKEEK